MHSCVRLTIIKNCYLYITKPVKTPIKAFWLSGRGSSLQRIPNLCYAQNSVSKSISVFLTILRRVIIVDIGMPYREPRNRIRAPAMNVSPLESVTRHDYAPSIRNLLLLDINYCASAEGRPDPEDRGMNKTNAVDDHHDPLRLIEEQTQHRDR